MTPRQPTAMTAEAPSTQGQVKVEIDRMMAAAAAMDLADPWHVVQLALDDAGLSEGDHQQVLAHLHARLVERGYDPNDQAYM